MTTWFTEAEAAVYLKVPEQALKLARYRKKVKSRKFCRVVQYMQEWLDDLREGKCEASPSSYDAKIVPIGLSTFPPLMDAEQRALVQARKIIAKQRKRSLNGFSKDANRSLPN